MKHTRQRNTRIAEELILLSYKFGAKDINLNIKHIDDKTIIQIEANNVTITEETLESIKNLLNVPRSSEMEEYYWNLTGESDIDCELALIGLMTDSAQIDLIDRNILKIKLYRNDKR